MATRPTEALATRLGTYLLYLVSPWMYLWILQEILRYHYILVTNGISNRTKLGVWKQEFFLCFYPVVIFDKNRIKKNYFICRQLSYWEPAQVKANIKMGSLQVIWDSVK